jgi:hypothetical protein
MEETLQFKEWIKKQRYTILLAIFCACLPVGMEIVRHWNANILKIINIDYLYNICNITFILISLFLLGNLKFLLTNDNGDKSRRLHDYVKEQFGDNSSLYKEGANELFARMEKAFRQFYYSWLIVWGIWLVMYIEKFIYTLELPHISETATYTHTLLSNTLNLANSFLLFFIYMVITISTVNRKKIPGHNLKQMNQGIFLMFFFGAGCFLLDFYSYFISDNPLSENYYYLIQLIVQSFIALLGCISLMAVLGRLNSSFLDIPQWMILTLYFYAAIQMFYPLDLLKDWTLQENASSSMASYLNMASKGIYILAFFGKIILLLAMLWTMRQKRFLFFLTRKAHTLAESDDMLAEFDRSYNGYR